MKRLLAGACFAVLLAIAAPALADTDCNAHPSAPFCRAQLDEIRAQTGYTIDEKNEIESPWHEFGTNVAVVTGTIAGLVALIGVITGLIQLRSTLKAANDNIALQRRNLELQQGQIVDNQYLEVLKRLADKAPATRIGAVPLLIDLAEGGEDKVSVPPRYIAKQLAAILSTEEKPPVIDAVARGFLDLSGIKPGQVKPLNPGAAAEVRESLNADFVQARRDDLAVALAEYDSFEAKQKGGGGDTTPKDSAQAVAGISADELDGLRASALYKETQSLAGQDGYFASDARFGQFATALRSAGKRLTTTQAIVTRLAA